MGSRGTVDFASGFTVTDTGTKIQISPDGTIVRTTGDQSLAGNKTFTGNTTLANTTVSNGSTIAVGNSSNTLTTQTAASVNTGNGLTTGQALNVSTGSSLFSTGNTQDATNATRGFFYGGLSNSYQGATTFSSTGNFTGTLVALTADQTTAGTVLGISAQNLTTGKAIDVSLGTLYSGTTDTVAGYTVGAVNVRAQSFTGNVFNVSAQGAGGATANLANFQSTQLAGQVLNVNATSLTTGKAVAVTIGTGGTGIYLNTAAAYSGNLIQLQMNGADRLRIDQAGNTTLGGTLTIQGASMTGPGAGAFSIDNGNPSAINIGGTTATTINIGRSGQIQALLGNATVAGTLGVGGATTLSSTLGVSGNTTVGGTLGVTGAGTFSSTLGVTGDLNVGASAFTVAAATGNTATAGTLSVTGNTSLGGTLAVTGNTTLSGTLTGPAAAVFSIDAGGAVGANNINIGGTNAATLNLGRTGQTQALLGNATVAGTLAVTGTSALTGNATFGGTITGPSAAAFSIDAGGLQNVNIGGTNAATLNLGRAGQTQALLGSGTVAGTFTVGNGAGNDFLGFAAEATNPACAPGDYRIWANSTDLNLKKCENGTITDLDTTAATGTWTKLAAATLGANGSSLSTGAFAAKKWLHVEIRIAGYTGGGTIAQLQFNGDVGANYSFARSDGVAAVTTGTAQTNIPVAQTSITGARYLDIHIRNVATQGKSLILEGISNSESSGTAPTINHVRGVWGNTTAQITSITMFVPTANMIAGTEIVVWGRDDD